MEKNTKQSQLPIKLGKKTSPILANIHIIVGRNGSGKTRLLDELYDKFVNVKDTVALLDGDFSYRRIVPEDNDIPELEKFVSDVFDVEYKYTNDWTQKNGAGFRNIIGLFLTLNTQNKNFVALIDNLEQSLHPLAQQRILPALQVTFPKAEIFCTTYSPFITNSVDNAWIYNLDNYED